MSGPELLIVSPKCIPITVKEFQPKDCLYVGHNDSSEGEWIISGRDKEEKRGFRETSLKRWSRRDWWFHSVMEKTVL